MVSVKPFCLFLPLGYLVCAQLWDLKFSESRIQSLFVCGFIFGILEEMCLYLLKEDSIEIQVKTAIYASIFMPKSTYLLNSLVDNIILCC